jgi:hypothetical protein
MIGPGRLLAWAAAVLLVGGGVAQAQTLIVSKAPAKATVEFSLNGTALGTATADATGVASLPFDVQARAGRPEIDVSVAVDVCGSQYRVMLLQGGEQAPLKTPNCERHDISGVYIVRKVTSLVVDLWQNTPTVWLRQGPPPPTWLSATPDVIERRTGPTRLSPKGLVVFGGSGFAKVSNLTTAACGTITCKGGDYRASYTFGTTLWLTRWLGVQGSFTKPGIIEKSGEGTTYNFLSELDSRVFALAANVGPAIGPIRFYAQGGATFQRSTLTTTQTVNDRTVTVDGTPVVIPGGTFSMKLPTQGWSWMMGAGFEGWVSSRTALYLELGRLTMKGTPKTGEGALDDRVTYLTAGLRISLWR